MVKMTNQAVKNKITQAFTNYVINELNVDSVTHKAKLQLVAEFREKVLDVAYPPKKNMIQRLMGE